MTPCCCRWSEPHPAHPTLHTHQAPPCSIAAAETEDTRSHARGRTGRGPGSGYGLPAGRRSIRASGAGLYAVAYAPAGRMVATAGDDGRIRLWDPLAARPLATLAAHTDEVFSPDGQTLASASGDHTLVR